MASPELIIVQFMRCHVVFRPPAQQPTVAPQAEKGAEAGQKVSAGQPLLASDKRSGSAKGDKAGDDPNCCSICGRSRSPGSCDSSSCSECKRVDGDGKVQSRRASKRSDRAPSPKVAPAGTDKGQARLLSELVEELLEELQVRNAVWVEGRHPVAHGEATLQFFEKQLGLVESLEDEGLKAMLQEGSGRETRIQIMIPSYSGQRTEQLFRGLQNLGLGEQDSFTSLWVLPMSLRLPGAQDEEKGDDVIKARVTVNQIINNLKSSAALTLDFIGLCFSASVISSVGLARDDTVTTVASMLISPLMSPILAFTFGAVIRDRPLIAQGLRTAAIGLAICVITGLLIGLACGHWGAEWSWPREFMSSRGEPEALLIGLIIAIPSGIGVALSVLGNNTGSLVGVAISAALLPPAVNSGLSFGLAFVAALEDTDVDAKEAAAIGAISLALTILNIFIIFVMGTAFLWIKSVAPTAAGATELWHHIVPTYLVDKMHRQKNVAQLLREVKGHMMPGEDIDEAIDRMLTDDQARRVKEYIESCNREKQIEEMDMRRTINLRAGTKSFDDWKASRDLLRKEGPRPEDRENVPLNPIHPPTYTTIKARRQQAGDYPVVGPHLFEEPTEKERQQRREEAAKSSTLGGTTVRERAAAAAAHTVNPQLSVGRSAPHRVVHFKKTPSMPRATSVFEDGTADEHDGTEASGARQPVRSSPAEIVSTPHRVVHRKQPAAAMPRATSLFESVEVEQRRQSDTPATKEEQQQQQQQQPQPQEQQQPAQGRLRLGPEPTTSTTDPQHEDSDNTSSDSHDKRSDGTDRHDDVISI